ncbi:uncharacterized protein [Procambarus clarkii]|uniref:uncharacterized protein n=1 Tax=Procambarus clarkii TaxID=6728 RepID=UPI00374331BC
MKMKMIHEDEAFITHRDYTNSRLLKVFKVTTKVRWVVEGGTKQKSFIVSQEAGSTTPREALNTTPREALNTTPREALNTTPREALNTTPREALNTTPREALTTTPREALTTTPREVLNTTMASKLTAVLLLGVTYMICFTSFTTVCMIEDELDSQSLPLKLNHLENNYGISNEM